jgi:hypothetical protein
MALSCQCGQRYNARVIRVRIRVRARVSASLGRSRASRVERGIGAPSDPPGDDLLVGWDSRAGKLAHLNRMREGGKSNENRKNRHQYQCRAPATVPGATHTPAKERVFGRRRLTLTKTILPLFGMEQLPLPTCCSLAMMPHTPPLHPVYMVPQAMPQSGSSPDAGIFPPPTGFTCWINARSGG